MLFPFLLLLGNSVVGEFVFVSFPLRLFICDVLLFVLGGFSCELDVTLPRFSPSGSLLDMPHVSSRQVNNVGCGLGFYTGLLVQYVAGRSGSKEWFMNADIVQTQFTLRGSLASMP